MHKEEVDSGAVFGFHGDEDQDDAVNFDSTGSAATTLAIVRLLLDASADPYAKNAYGSTALYIAAHQANTEVVRMLIEARVDIDARENGFKLTPLVTVLKELKLADNWGKGYAYPPRRAYEETIALLLDSGADVNLPDVDGMTPLHIAARDCHLDMVQKLLLLGADEHAQTAAGKTAFELVLDGLTTEYVPLGASRVGYICILEILVQRSGQKLNARAIGAIVEAADRRAANAILYYHLVRKRGAIQDGLDKCGLSRDVRDIVVSMLYA